MFLGIGVGSRYRACERCDAGKSRTSTKSRSVYQGRRDGMAGIRIDFTAWFGVGSGSLSMGQVQSSMPYGQLIARR